MLKQALKPYKWYAMGSLLMVIVIVSSSLLQPSYLSDVLAAVLENDRAKIASMGVWLLRLLREYRQICGKLFSGKFKPSPMPILKNLMLEIWLSG